MCVRHAHVPSSNTIGSVKEIMNITVPKIFERNVPHTYQALHESIVGIAGCGGLGSNAAVALVRAGVGTLIIADHDVVEESNLNRQYYFQSDIGKPKVDALSAHLKAINPHIQIVSVQKYLHPDEIAAVFHDASLLIEAFDRADSKAWLIESWCTAFPQRPVICASGLSGIGETETLKVRHAGTIYLVGDEKTQMHMGLCSARVAIVANMQANIAIELLAKSKGKGKKNDPGK